MMKKNMIAVYLILVLSLITTIIVYYRSKGDVSSKEENTASDTLQEDPVYLKEENTAIFSSASEGTDVHLGSGEILTEGQQTWQFSQMNGVLDECKTTCNSLKNCMGFSRAQGLDSESLPCYMKSGRGTKQYSKNYDMFLQN